MPNDILQNLLGLLQQSAQPRPDLITPGSTGVLENARPATFAGRMTFGNERIADLLNRFPQGELESGGTSMQTLPGGLMLGGMAKRFLPGKPGPEAVRQVGNKIFKPGPGQIAELAKPGVKPLSGYEKMWPALIDERTGQIIHAQKPGIGLHEEELYPIARTIKGFMPTRGFVDPLTWNAFTEAMLERARILELIGGE